jgi:hypothetical protein
LPGADNIIYLIRSSDGLHWSEPVELFRAPNHQIVSPTVVRQGRGDWWMWSVYRSTFAYDPFTDAVAFWYSGARFEGSAYVWKAAVERRHRAEVFANVTSIEDGTLFAPPPAPLIDWP